MGDITFSALPQDVRDFLVAKVASGEFTSPDQLTVAALRAYRDNEAYNAWLKAEVQAGIDELDAGLEEPWDIDEIRAELLAELDEQGRPRQ